MHRQRKGRAEGPLRGGSQLEHRNYSSWSRAENYEKLIYSNRTLKYANREVKQLKDKKPKKIFFS